MSVVTRTDSASAAWSNEFGEPFLVRASEPAQIAFDVLFTDDAPRVKIEMVAGLPMQLVDGYAKAAARHANVVQVEVDHWFASIAGLKGIWGEGDTEDEARAEVQRSIPEWIAVRREHGQLIPKIDGFDLNV
jgi:predicted RNase H-like HicB family nuclease